MLHFFFNKGSINHFTNKISLQTEVGISILPLAVRIIITEYTLMKKISDNLEELSNSSG